jgi:toxin ParE1/3/4
MATERYHPLFVTDLAAACSYYDTIGSALGDRFRENVRSAIRAVVERPDSFGRIGGDFRGALVDRFPYVVVFTVDDDDPSIFGLRHAASDRNDWFGRTMPSESG